MDEHATALNDNAAALDYACHMVRELRTNGGYDDPRLVVTVKNEMRQIASRYKQLLPLECHVLSSKHLGSDTRA
jgi:hypothetical protein